MPISFLIRARPNLLVFMLLKELSAFHLELPASSITFNTATSSLSQ